MATKTILNLTHEEARTFLLKPESYCSLDLPPYIVFDPLIRDVNQELDGKRLVDLRGQKPRDFDDVNYTILHNKDGRYAWRPFELIHPALYVSLVHAITEEGNWKLIKERFDEFAANDKIRCLSLPVVSESCQKDRAEQIQHWWHEVEQKSIELSLDYNHLIETDITDCYGAIYTHSISWALHTKPEAKKRRQDQNLVGNVIDTHIQDMRHGQTNGIPQGSVLMDFIAEMVLGLADLELTQRLKTDKVDDYQILRYRDDYRVFVNSPQTGETIIKLISEMTASLGLKLNPTKTKTNDDVVHASIKSDKLAWMSRKQSNLGLHKQLLVIHDHAMNFPNGGSLVVALNDYHRRVLRIQRAPDNLHALIAILVDIAYRNPRTYAICVAILSKLLSFFNKEEERLKIADRIHKKFLQLPNTGHMQIWLQRMTLPSKKDIQYAEPICQLVAETRDRLWNNDWVSSQALKDALDAKKIVDTKVRNDVKQVIPQQEVELFVSKMEKGYYG